MRVPVQIHASCLVKVSKPGLCQIIADLLIFPICVMDPSVTQLQRSAKEFRLHQVLPAVIALGLVIKMHRILSLPRGYCDLLLLSHPCLGCAVDLRFHLTGPLPLPRRHRDYFVDLVLRLRKAALQCGVRVR